MILTAKIGVALFVTFLSIATAFIEWNIYKNDGVRIGGVNIILLLGSTMMLCSTLLAGATSIAVMFIPIIAVEIFTLFLYVRQ